MADPLKRRIEDALKPGRFIDWRGSADILHRLAEARGEIEALVAGGEAARAVSLYETLLAACYLKVEEVDDSDGLLGDLMDDLYAGWIRAREAAGLDPHGTAETLLGWIEEDEYGFADELACRAVEVFGEAGLTAFERALCRRWLARPRDPEGRDYRRSQAVEALKAVHARRLDAAPFAALCEEEGDLSPRDCERLAEIHRVRGRLDEALAWVERGLETEEEGRDPWPIRTGRLLPGLRRRILRDLGRGEEALASAWEAYREEPSPGSYEDLMEYVPDGERADWHARAVAELSGAPLSTKLRLLAAAGDDEELARVVEAASREELMALSHFTTEPAAEALARTHPLPAAKLNLALGLRIVEAKKSRYYQEALDHLAKARRLLLDHGREDEWEAFVAEVREEHGRKRSFMPGLERIDAGRREPTFLERAKEGWEKRRGAK